MVKKNRIKMLSFAVGLCVGCCAYGIANNITANAEENGAVVKTAQNVSWKMAYGATVRMASNEENMGIRFTAQMPTADYEALEANTQPEFLKKTAVK